MPSTEQLTRTIFLDTETTGLDCRRHKLWNVGMVINRPDGSEDEFEWMWWPNLSTADPMALKVNRFYDRAGDMLEAPWSDTFEGDVRADHDGVTSYLSPPRAAHDIAHFLDGSTIVGAIPWFDVQFLIPWLAEHGQVFTGHYHLIDVEALAVGFIRGDTGMMDEKPLARPPWRSTDLSNAVGVNPDDFDRHSALGDARWAKAIYEAVMGR